IQLHRFAADVFLVGRLRGIEEWSVIDDGIEVVRNSTGLFKSLRVSKFDFRACLGLQSANELIDKAFFFDFSELYCKLRHASVIIGDRNYLPKVCPFIS